ncbi:MAG: Signal peptidase I [uncultured Rubrobacteraceae bacterium]|uniref:Signal peptidase I n=1 Tax=uncultured Rubrobacteraceae bacterium TaxID=349277 RepID=A0A6J4RAC3_9ACTN|nr:MAG: Signal peptidase I [uncultured Rubrobacteraceae bacterium]
MPEKPYYEDEQFRTSEEERRTPKKKGGGALEYLVILLVSFALVFGFVRPFVVEAFWIPSGSMIPTLQINDRVLVNKFIYRFTEPKPGDIVVFQSVDNEDEDLIKRVVAVAGDRVSVRNGRLIVDGERQREPFTNKKFPDRSFFAPVTVPKDHVWVMGDNRANSADSRVFGPLPKENIEGEAFLRFWPLDRIGLL